jgi:hypothetical protein
MKMHHSYCYPFFILLISLIYSCGNASNESNNGNGVESEVHHKALREEVIAIHDEVMPKMGALKNHQKRLSEEIVELQGRGEAIDREEIVLRQDLVIRLDQAYEGMFVWMRQFKTHELDEMDEEESKAYLLEQKEKVEKVNMDIKSALSSAEEVRLVKE